MPLSARFIFLNITVLEGFDKSRNWEKKTWQTKKSQEMENASGFAWKKQAILVDDSHVIFEETL